MRFDALKILGFGLALAACITSATSAVRQHVLLDTGWRFHLGDVAEGPELALNDLDWRALDLPHDWSAESEFSPTNASGTGYLPGGIGWYRKTFATDATWTGKRVFVTFDGVYRNATIWINGHSLGERPYGYSTFQHELTPYLVKSGDNVLAVRVARENVADSRWYPGSGIYRHVWLTATHPVHVPLWDNYITTPRATPESADVVVRTEVTNQTAAAQSVRVTWQLLTPDGTTLTEHTQTESLAPAGGHTFSHWQMIATPPSGHRIHPPSTR